MKLTTIILLVLLPMTTPAQTPRDSIPTDSLGTHELAEITVTSQRPLVRQEVDKLTYDVAHDKDAKASNVLDMLKKVPMVSVDGNDEIRVNGDSSFKIYKNGHPNPAFNGQGAKDILRNMPASSIKRIEVITDPGAKYDAEGTTMILNIVTEEGASLVGLSGYAGLQANTLGYTAPYFGITAKKGKWTADNYLTYIYQPDKMNSYTDVYDYDFPSIGQKRHESIREDHHINALYDVLSASYEADSLNFLSLEGNLFYYEIGGFKMSHDYANTLYDGDILSRYTALNRLPKHRYMDASVRADFEHKTHRDGEALTLSYMLTTVRSRRDMASEFSRPDSTHRPAWEYDGYLSTRQELFLENTFQTDYIRPLWKGHKMEVGAKYINRTNRSKSGQDYFGTAALPDSTRSHFKHLTQVAAAYMEYIYNGRRWSARAGLRYEYSHLEARFPDRSQPEFHTNLGDWCPSASLMYKFAETYTLKLCYGTNINRPGIGYLNPMRFTTPTGGSYGNPNLESNKQHQLTLTFAHTGTKTSYQLTPSFSLSNDMIGVSMSADGNQTWDHLWQRDSLAHRQPQRQPAVAGHPNHEAQPLGGWLLPTLRQPVAAAGLRWMGRMGIHQPLPVASQGMQPLHILPHTVRTTPVQRLRHRRQLRELSHIAAKTLPQRQVYGKTVVEQPVHASLGLWQPGGPRRLHHARAPVS